jgi:lysyl-tRNA synthetase class II
MCSNVANGDSVSAGNTTEELEAQIKAKGDEIRAMKEEGAGKDKIAPLVQDLLSLKAEYSAVAGIPFGGEAAKKEPKKKSPPKKPKVQQSVAAVSLNLEKVIMSPHGPLPLQSMGDYETVASRQETGRIFTPISDLGVSVNAGEQVWIRGRVQSVRAKGGSAFVVLRGAKGATVQALKFKDKSGDDGAVEESKMLIKYIGSRSLESVVEIRGTLRSAEVRSCTQTNVEVEVDSLYTVSSAEPVLPFLVEDAARSEEAVESSQSTDRPFPRLGQELRLDNRWLDLRTPANNSIMRVQSEICHLFRESLRNAGFLEIHTPKLILGESEGGADVFRTDYFGQSACLAQSPQIYKQMAIAGDLDRVFEIGPVFRAENSNTRRHLCEFTGLDLVRSF